MFVSHVVNGPFSREFRWLTEVKVARLEWGWAALASVAHFSLLWGGQFNGLLFRAALGWVASPFLGLELSTLSSSIPGQWCRIPVCRPSPLR